MNRTLNVVRLQLINRQTFLWLPLIILFGALGLSLLVYGIIAAAGVDGVKISGGAQAPLWYFGVVGAQALTRTFPFSQAMSVTRREFFTGTLLTAGITAVVLSIVFVAGGLVEQATNGYGMNGYFFYMPWLWEAGPFAAGVTFFAVAMFFFVIGFWGATIFKRFGALVTTVTLVGAGLLLVVLIALVTLTRSWPAVLEGGAALGAFGMALWGLVLIAALASSSFLTLRRATP
ncbi:MULTISPECIES: hypothetical protein [Microbacterium]|uniref:hypothetical protein n=1 Tax=Microbacterium TaxID=33882 RepID=UPI002785EE48|nr:MULTISPECIES: hypothetical protein [Microbacterium]MDQ1076902.1 hypothetical protein [Microbacterium sp. SORGH_AS_0969]MDQ1117139.1 hypothetical protein [Microbacterium testaceum]